MNNGFCLQEILGTDKRNPCFTIYRDENLHRLHVYYGGQLFEKVPDDQTSPEYRLMIARLYNAGVKAVSLQRAFGVDRKTMRRWGSALKSGDMALLVQILAGRSGHRKLTSEVVSYVRMRFPDIYLDHPCDYSTVMRTEIARVFGKQLCAETLRPLFKELKGKVRVAVDPGLPDGDTGCDVEVVEDGLFRSKSVEEVASDRNESPVFSGEPDGTVLFAHHLGVLLFSSLLVMVCAASAEHGFIVKQWLAAILLGAVNIEQSKLLDYNSLESILGRTLRCLGLQRQKLCALASTAAADRFLQLNAKEVNMHTYDTFYYDPHTKHYTGALKILKGWCGGKHFADKVLHMDFIHTTEGHPVFLKHADNYEDLRERFGKVAAGFRHLLGIKKDRVLTFILDRGIYGKTTFERVLADEYLHVVTWEKDYKPTVWDEKEVKGKFILERCRNHSEDIKKYLFEYMDQDWEKDPAMRQLRVQATNPKGRTIELGILSDARDRTADEIIRFMFCRWIQENDFKYLERHFGINQITSYASVPYEELKTQVENKQMKSGEYKALEQGRSDIRNHLKRLLLQEHQHPQRSANRQTKIKELTRKDKDLTQTMKQTQKEMSRLDYLVERQYRGLDTSNKRVMDVLKIIGRNAFYRALEPFRQSYNNYRDDHVIFRNLTHAHGCMVCRDNQVEVHLYPTAQYPPALRKIVEKTLQQINDKKPRMPDGSQRIITFKLGKKEGIKLASPDIV